MTISASTTLQTDILIIGSGAGELSAAGYEVLVIEKGAHYDDMDFHGFELESNRDLFENFGALTTADVSLAVLDEWASEFGFSGVTSADYQRSLDVVSQCINVNTAESIANAQNTALERGCKALGYGVAVLPRNVKGCAECGFCNFGCPIGSKQRTLKTYLRDACEHSARIVDRVRHQGGRVTGALATVTDEGGYGYRIETPAAQPGIIAATLPWRSGEQHHAVMGNIHHFASFIVLTRDFYSGRVRLSRDGKPVLHYHLHSYAAGARILYSPHAKYLVHQVNGERSLASVRGGCQRLSDGQRRQSHADHHGRSTSRRSRNGRP